MDDSSFPLLRENPVLVLFLILGLGVLIGRIKIKGIEVGGVTGVLLIGMIAGHLRLPVPVASHNIGFVLFIYAVGVQAGPRFLGAFREDGLKYVVLALVTVATGAGIAAFFAVTFDLEIGAGAGLLAGSLTSTPTLVAAQDAVAQGMQLPEGVTEEQVLENVSATYAITYVFGLAGLILVLSLLPRLLRVDLAAEAHDYGQRTGLADTGRRIEQPTIRAYRVENEELVGLPAGPLSPEIPGELQRIKRDREVLDPGPEVLLQLGDVVTVIGPEQVHSGARRKVGPEVLDEDVLDRSVESRTVIVTHRDVEGRTLAELEITRRHQCWLTRVTRLGMDLPRRADLKLQRGDALLLTGAHSQLDRLADELGYSETKIQETDLVTFAFGIALGLLLGLPTIAIGPTAIGLGMAGGVLVGGLLMGLLHQYRPAFGRLPHGARYMLMELGLLFFMVQVAVSAGASIVETFAEAGPQLVLFGIVVTLVPVFACTLVGRVVLRMNLAILLGAVTGAVTSTAALRQSSDQARSSVPMLGYVGTYAFANVLLTIAGAILVRL